jgi:hypothetical protein
MRLFASAEATSDSAIQSDPSRQPLTIPDHATLKSGLLRRLIRDAQLDLESYRDLLSR